MRSKSPGAGKGLGPRFGNPNRGPKPREAPPATRGPMHPRRRFLLRQNDDARLPMTRPHLRGSIRHWAPQPSRPSLSGGVYYVTPSPCEDEGQNPEKKLGNSLSGCSIESRVFRVKQGAHDRSRYGGQAHSVADAVTMSMPLSEPSVLQSMSTPRDIPQRWGRWRRSWATSPCPWVRWVRVVVRTVVSWNALWSFPAAGLGPVSGCDRSAR